MTADLTNLRAEFRENGLNRSELDNDPFKQFSLWFSQAIKSGIVEPSAMSLATADGKEIGIRTLISQFESMKNKFSKGEVPLPDFWGGYRVIPDSIEFWQGRESRLHDRFIYQRSDNGWNISRLSP